MDKVVDWLAPVIARAEQTNPPEDGDYTDDEGFLVCGKCHTRRQTMIREPDIRNNGEAKLMKVMVQCKCRKEAELERQRQQQREQEMDAIRELKKQSLMDDRFADATFDLFRRTKYNARNLKLCKRFAEHFDEMLKKDQGLLLYGDVGTGKTFAAACIANYLLQHRVPVVMTSFVKLLDAMQGGRDDGQAVIGKLNKAKLLIIDDLGAERSTEYALEKVYDIVDSRYRAKLPIILTTNLTLEEMQKTDDRRYARIYDRIFELCYPMQFAGPSWRKVDASRRFEDMRAFLEDDNG